MARGEGTALKFQGHMPYRPEQKVDDWGLDAEQQETHVEQFRVMLEQRGAWRKEDHDYYTLLRFLRARNYDFDKAAKMWLDTLEWRRELEVDAILDQFVFHEREQFLMAYPQGYHKTDKLGRPVYIQLLGRIDIATLKQITTEERMIRFHVQEYERCGRVIMPICSRLAGRQVDQTFGIMDVKGVGLSHLSGEVKRLMTTLTKYDQDNYPEMLGRICIINAPMVFKAVWALVKPLLNPRTLSKIQICQSDYTRDLLQWVDADNLPDWLGGRSKGTLLDDVGPWSDPEVLRRIEGQLPVAARALKRLASAAGDAGPLLLDDADGGGGGGGGVGSAGGVGGYHSPRSEASFVSITSSAAHPPSMGGAAAAAGVAGADGAAGMAAPLLLSHQGSLGWAPGGRGSMSATGEEGAAAAAAAAAAVSGAGAPHEALAEGAGDSGSVSAPAGAVLTIAAVNAHKQRNLLERLAALEELYGRQMQRLKGYMPASAFGRLTGRLGAPRPGIGSGGGVLQRLELLEEGMELLMRAQELSWQAEEQRRRDRCCGGSCVIC